MMDTSETYIKMRLQAIDELGVGVKPRGSLVRTRHPKISVDDDGNFFYDFYAFCQLERQDQLQEMVGSKFNEFVWFVDRYHGIGVDEFWVDNEKLPSREQLELVFLMKEKYNKVWVNNEWRNESE